MKSRLIAIEGIDGSGKPTLVEYIYSRLKSEGYNANCIVTCEKEKESVYRAVIDSYDLDPLSPAYMFFYQVLHAKKTDRAFAALDKEEIVIADRWDLSFIVWHKNFGFFSEESPQLLEGVSRLAFRGLKPNLGIYLDITLSNALDRRLNHRKEVINDIKLEKRIYNKALSTYKKLARQNNWKIVNANKSLDEVKESVWKLVSQAIKEDVPPREISWRVKTRENLELKMAKVLFRRR